MKKSSIFWKRKKLMGIIFTVGLTIIGLSTAWYIIFTVVVPSVTTI